MTAKEYLSQTVVINHRIDSKLEQAVTLRSLAMKVTTTFGEDRVQSTKKQSPMEDIMVKLIDLEKEVNDDIDELIRLKAEILETIDQVEDVNQQIILEKRYIAGKTWEDIARETGYDRSTIYRNHGKALKEIDEILKNATKSH